MDIGREQEIYPIKNENKPLYLNMELTMRGRSKKYEKNVTVHAF